VAALNAHEGGELVVAVGLLNAGRGGDELDLVRVPRDLLLDGVDQLQGAAGVLALVLDGFDPDGEELRAQVAFVDGVEIEIAAVERIGEVKVLIDKALRGVGVGVDDDGGVMDPFGLAFWLASWRAYRLRFGRIGAPGRRGEQSGQGTGAHRLGMSLYRRSRNRDERFA